MWWGQWLFQMKKITLFFHVLQIILLIFLGITTIINYSKNNDLKTRINQLSSTLSYQSQFSDMIDFSYNFVSRLSNGLLFDDKAYCDKHLTSKVIKFLKEYLSVYPKIIQYNIANISMYKNNETIVTGKSIVLGKNNQKIHVEVYFYIEGYRSHFVITNIEVKANGKLYAPE